jgi:hypothetical protein
MKKKEFPHTFSGERNVNDPERIASASVGAGLIVSAIRDISKPDMATWFKLAGGAYFLYRALLAYCPVKDLFEKQYPEKPATEKDFSRKYNGKQHVYG